MLDKIIIADTSCLIALNNIDELYILQELYDTVWTTSEVNEEYGEPLPSFIQVKEVIDKKNIALLALTLDVGEASAIALALETQYLLWEYLNQYVQHEICPYSKG